MWRSKTPEDVPRLFRVANGKTEVSLLIGQGSHVVERDGDAGLVSQALFDRQALFIKLHGPGVAALIVVDGANVVVASGFPLFVALFAVDRERTGVIPERLGPAPVHSELVILETAEKLF